MGDSKREIERNYNKGEKDNQRKGGRKIIRQRERKRESNCVFEYGRERRRK